MTKITQLHTNFIYAMEIVNTTCQVITYNYIGHTHVHTKVIGFCFNFNLHHAHHLAPCQDDLLTGCGDIPARSLGLGTTGIQRPGILPNMAALPKCSLSALWTQCCHMFAIESLTRGCLEIGEPTYRDIAMNFVEPLV